MKHIWHSHYKRHAVYAVMLSSALTAISLQATAQNDPLLTLWLTQQSGQYARVIEIPNGAPKTTWPSAGLPYRGGGQSLPAYSDIQQISFSNNYVYVRSSGLASYLMGPWQSEMGGIFQNWPSNQRLIYRFTRQPQAASNKVMNGLGPIGLWVNGVTIFNMLDGFAYNPAMQRESPVMPNQLSQAFWLRNAVVVEGVTFDKAKAHQPENGQYHNHENPIALRYQLKDHVAYNTATGNYQENPTQLHHSPLLGWMNDGFPVYGPYGYLDPQNPDSGVKRMVSGYVIRDGRSNTTDLRATGRRTLPLWAARMLNRSPQLTAQQYGPNVSTQYALGRYIEDFDFLGDLGFSHGVDFDLDLYNGRFCKTPDYPNGTYAYFISLDENGNSAFPYIVGRQWYGTLNGGRVNSITENVTLYQNAGPHATIYLKSIVMRSGALLRWNSVEGGHYRIEGAHKLNQWQVIETHVASQGLETTHTLSAANSKYRYYRVELIALDPYDPVF